MSVRAQALFKSGKVTGTLPGMRPGPPIEARSAAPSRALDAGQPAGSGQGARWMNGNKKPSPGNLAGLSERIGDDGVAQMSARDKLHPVPAVAGRGDFPLVDAEESGFPAGRGPIGCGRRREPRGHPPA